MEGFRSELCPKCGKQKQNVSDFSYYDRSKPKGTSTFTGCYDCFNEFETEDNKKEMSITELKSIMARLHTAPQNEQHWLVDSAWGKVNPEIVASHKGANENYYHFKFPYGEIVLNGEEALSANKFRMEFQRIYGVLLPPVRNLKWSTLLTSWLDERTESESEEISDTQEIVDGVLNYITTSRLVKGTGHSVLGTVYYHDEKVLVPSEIIKKLALKVNRNVKLRKVSNILKEFMMGPTKQYWTGTGYIRMWAFNPNHLKIDVSQAIDLEGDDE